jgi:hypothetical protein
MESTEYVTLNLRVPKGAVEFVNRLIEAGADYDSAQAFFEEALLMDVRATIDCLEGRAFDCAKVYKKFQIPKSLCEESEPVSEVISN